MQGTIPIGSPIPSPRPGASLWLALIAWSSLLGSSLLGSSLPGETPAAPDPGTIFEQMVATADKGNDPMLMLNVALILFEGNPSPATWAKAQSLMERAARAGLPYAMAEIARMHAKGLVDRLPQDRAAAFAWMKLALVRTLKERDKAPIEDMLEYMQKSYPEEDLEKGARLLSELDKTIPRLAEY